MFNHKGFTIIETMIVLAVSAFLFVAAVAALNSKESDTAFITSANTVQSLYQQYLTYDSDGYFNFRGNYNYLCSSNANPQFPGQSSLGSSPTCIFLGSVFSPNKNNLNIYQIIGSSTYNNYLNQVNNYQQESSLYLVNTFSTVNTTNDLQFIKMLSSINNQPTTISQTNQFAATINSNSAVGGSQLGLGLEVVKSGSGQLTKGSSFSPSLLEPASQVVLCYLNMLAKNNSRYAVYYFSEGDGTINVNLKLQNQCS